MQTKKFGLVGRSLAHSFSAKYLNKRFSELGVNAEYKLYDLPNIERIIDFAFDNNLDGFNVTMPYKQEIMPYLTSITDEALTIGAVNTVKVKDDASGFHGNGQNTEGISAESHKAGLTQRE